MKTFIGSLLIVIGVVVGVILSVNGIRYGVQYTNTVENYWTLADRASTISQKSDYIDKFVTSLEDPKYAGQYDALIFFTPENSFDANLTALKSLQTRLHDIKTMDENSFAYQSAIQQITAQEQGQAADMLGVFEGVWWKTNHYSLWNPFFIALYFLLVVVLIGGGICIIAL